MLNLLLMGIFKSTESFSDQKLESDIFMEMMVINVPGSIVCWYLIKSDNDHSELIDYLFLRMQHHRFLKLVLDNNRDSLLILDDSQKINYSNPSFRN